MIVEARCLMAAKGSAAAFGGRVVLWNGLCLVSDAGSEVMWCSRAMMWCAGREPRME